MNQGGKTLSYCRSNTEVVSGDVLAWGLGWGARAPLSPTKKWMKGEDEQKGRKIWIGVIFNAIYNLNKVNFEFVTLSRLW
jgi:hypothetical protein